MKTLILILLLLSTVLACKTTPEGERVPDWDRFADACELAAGEFSDIAAVAEDEQLKSDLVALAALATTAAETTRGVDPDGVASTLEIIMDLSLPILETTENERLQLALMGIRTAVRFLDLIRD